MPKKKTLNTKVYFKNPKVKNIIIFQNQIGDAMISNWSNIHHLAHYHTDLRMHSQQNDSICITDYFLLLPSRENVTLPSVPYHSIFPYF